VKTVVRIEVMDFKSAVIAGGTPLVATEGGAFSLLFDCVDI
jgi:hypothetical protein